MMRCSVVIAIATFLPMALWGQCADGDAAYMQAHREVLQKHGDTIHPGAYTFKQLSSDSGYAYLFYFNTGEQPAYAHSILVVLDEQCRLKYIQDTPRISEFRLVSSAR
jgi:L-fucose isomerase-like protein